VQRKDLIELDLGVEAAMSLVISAGMVQPDGGGDAQKKLAALAAQARATQAAEAAKKIDPVS
jgi:uncharacterized membrane protein